MAKVKTTPQNELSEAIVKVMAETYALYGKAHSYHWNVTGPRFPALHAMFMTHYTELWTSLDVLAERIRALGVFAPTSFSELAAAASLPTDNGVPEAEVMVKNLVQGYEVLAGAAKTALKLADGAGDPVTVDLMTQRASVAEKAAWMLRASM